jgi:hypothetical protein
MTNRFYGPHLELVDRYEISIYQLAIDLYLFTIFVLCSTTDTTFIGIDYMSKTVGFV